MGSEDDIKTDKIKDGFNLAGLDIKIIYKASSSPDNTIKQYVEDHDIDILITGAYSHSRVHNILLGSTTATLIKSCKVPLILFR